MKTSFILLCLTLLLAACAAPSPTSAPILPAAPAPSTPSAPPTLPPADTPQPDATPIQLLDWTDYRSEDGKDVHVAGELKNISDRTICGVIVSIRQYGKYDALMAWDSGPTQRECIPPAETSAFHIVTPRHISTLTVQISKISWQP